MNGVVWAGEQEGQKLKKKQKIDTGVDNFTYMGTAPTKPIITKFGVRGLVGDIITGDKSVSYTHLTLPTNREV